MLEQNGVTSEQAVVAEQLDAAMAAENGDGAERDGPDARNAERVKIGDAMLTRAQVLALRALEEGKSLNEAAAAAKVDRGTLFRWRIRDPHFIAANNAWRREQLEFGRDQMLLLRNTAMNAITSRLKQGDGRLALALLDRMNGKCRGPGGQDTAPTLPDMVEGPDVERPEGQAARSALERSFLRLPAENQGKAGTLLELAGRVAGSWGMVFLEQLAEHPCAREIEAGEAGRLFILCIIKINRLLRRKAKAMGSAGDLTLADLA